MNSSYHKHFLIALSALLFFSACGTKQDEESKDINETSKTPSDSIASKTNEVIFTSAQYKLAEIETGTVEMRSLSNIIKVNGAIDVEPSNMAMVSAPLGGYVKTAGLLPGQAIKKGQVLATLENPEFITLQQDYLESKGRLQYLEQEYQRQEKLRKEDINSAKTFQQVASDYKVMQARINGLEQRLALAGINTASLRNGKISRSANLYAPISGYIKSSNVNIGKYVNPSDVLFELINKNDLHLALNAFEKDLGKIKVGQTVKFSLAKENNYNRTAKIFLVGQSAGSDGIIPVHCHLQKQDESDLLPGMYVKAWIETGTEKQSAVPTDAIVQLEGKDYLILQKEQSATGYKFQLEQIKKGTEQEGYTAITLPENFDSKTAKIVVKNAYAILSVLKNSEE